MSEKISISELVENSMLASPPDLLFKIINSLDSELSSRQISEIVGHDLSISAQVLKLSNSSFFGFKGSIKTLDRAINILGTKTVRNIAVTTLLFAHTNKIKLWNLDIINFWLHAFLVADITREVSQKVGLDGDESYIAGLLHDIGKLILYSQKQEKADIFTVPHTAHDIDAYEQETWGVTSTQLGKLLLEKWNIPQETVQAISSHTSPSGTSVLSKIIYLANEFASVCTDNYYKSTMTAPVFQKVLSDIKLNESGLEKICTEIPGIVERGKFIMQVLSKKQNLAIRKRMTTRATLVSENEISLTKCLLQVLDFQVDVITPSMIKANEEALRLEAERRKKLLEATDEDEAEKEAVPEKKESGFLKRLFQKKAVEQTEDDENLVRTEPTKPLNWNTLVVFDKVIPFKINKTGVTVYQVLTNPAEIRENPLPFFFSNIDIKVK